MSSPPPETSPLRPAGIVAPSVLVLVVASVIGVYAWPTFRTVGFCDSEVRAGANVDHAVGLALLCGVFGSVALLALRRAPRKLAVALLVMAVLLSVCMALISFDSAAYAIRTPYVPGDMFDCPDSEITTIHHVSYLYPVWGSAAALLLVQFVRALVLARLRSESETDVGENDESE